MAKDVALPDPNTSPTRDKILAAAFSLFMRHGYEGASLNQIVAASGVSKGAFYHYFPSKLDVYQQVITAFYLKPFSGFDVAGLADLTPGKARAALRKYYKNLPNKIGEVTDQDMGQVFALMFDAMSRLPGFRQKIAKSYSRLLKSLSISIAKSKSPSKLDKRKARKFLARLEGEVFLGAIGVV